MKRGNMETVIAIPYLSRKGESVYREGLGKFLRLMINGMLDANPDVSIEIWVYSQGVPAIKQLFKEQIEKNPERIRIIDDFSVFQNSKAYKQRIENGDSIEKIRKEYENETRLGKGFLFRSISFDSFRHRHNLIKNVKKESKADYIYYFCVNYVPIIGVSKPTLIQVHDLFTMKYEKLFASDSWRYWITNRAVRVFLGLQRLRGAHFVCSSNSTREEQCLKYIPFSGEDNVHLLRFPAMVKEYPEMDDADSGEFCKKYSLTSRYIAYPTQNRPNKNMITLLKAMQLLKQKGTDIKLAITGCFNDVEECRLFIENNPEIKEMLIETGSLSEEDLYLFYKNAAMVASTSFIEGACVSGQVLEALQIGGVPVIHALSDGIDEWLGVHGYTRETADMNWFERFDYVKLAELIEDVLVDKDKHIKKQAHIFKGMKSVGWGETGTRYLELLRSLD